MLNRCGCEKGEYIWLAPNHNSEEAAQPRPAFRPHLLARQAWKLERVTKTFRCHAHGKTKDPPLYAERRID